MLVFNRLLITILMMLAATLAHSAGEDEFLPVNEAFKVSATVEGHQIHYTWIIADGYYLYLQRFSFELSDESKGELGEPIFEQQPEHKIDPTFGEVQVFHHQVDVRVPVLGTPDGFVEVSARYQGCAEKGLCYIPQNFTDMYQVDTKAAAPITTPATSTNGPTTPNSAASATGANTDLDENDALSLENFLAKSSFFTIVGVFFLIGIGLTFTPCVLPMIPILSSIIVGQGEELSRKKAAILSVVYVLGMAVTYAIAGVIAGRSGQNLTVAMQNPTVLYSFAAIFVLLSLSMFGFYELQLPAFVRDRLNHISQRQQGGTYLGVAIIGMLSALVVSPCVSAPLAGALLYIGKTGNWQLGGTSLLALGLGMGAPLIAIGVTGANMLPKAGGWMDNVKALFGVILLGVALWLVKHLVPTSVIAVITGLLAILAGLYLGALDPIATPKGKLFKGMGILALVAGAALIFNSVSPRSSAEAAVIETVRAPFQKIRTQAELDAALASASARQQPVMLDLYADWCTACVEMDHENFTNPQVQSLLTGYHWLQLDLTDNPEDQLILSRFSIPGPPAVMFYAPDGAEVSAARLYAFKPRAEFLQHLQTHNLSTR